MYPTAQEIISRRQLIEDVNAVGTPETQQEVAAFKAELHDEQMNILAQDTYWSAKGHLAPPEQRNPPAGWTRASENLPLLRETYPALAERTDKELLQMLKPSDSSFRAEIYLPDPAILGPDFKPVIVPKGSANEVLVKDSVRGDYLRDSTTEDFVANNFPQSIGRKTDYYDRAMNLATFMQNNGFKGEFAGHSLAGGMGASMSAVTGLPATTFNAAGLHPATALRFAAENPGVKVRDASQLVVNYQVKGELLNDGIQNNMERLDAQQRRVLGAVLGDVATLMRDLPQGQQLLESAINHQETARERAAREAKQSQERPGMPFIEPGTPLSVSATAAVNGFLQDLATKDPGKLLGELPLAVGQLRVLDQVKGLDNGKAIDRTDQMTLADATVLAIPVMRVAGASLKGARLGEELAQIPAAGLSGIGSVVDKTGSHVEAATRKVADFSDVVARTSVNATSAIGASVGNVAATGREKLGQAEAHLDNLQGSTQHAAASLGSKLLRNSAELGILPESVRHGLNESADSLEKFGSNAVLQNRQEAQQAQRQAHADAESIRRTAHDGITTLAAVHVSGADQLADTLRGAGRQANNALNAGGGVLDAASDSAKAFGATQGALVGGAVGAAERVATATPIGQVASGKTSAAYNAEVEKGQIAGIKAAGTSLTFGGARDLARDIDGTVKLAQNAKLAGGEAFARHLDYDTISPTIDAKVEGIEAALRKKYADHLRHPPISNQPADLTTDPLVSRVHRAVEKAEGKIGKGWDENSERLTASLSVLARKNGFTANDEITVSFNADTQRHRAGELVQISRSGSNASPDPVANRTHMDTSSAIAHPAAETYETYRSTNRELEQQAAAAQRSQQEQVATPARAQ